MKKLNLILVVVLVLSLIANIVLFVNYSSSMKKAIAYKKKVADIEKIAKRTKYAFLNSLPQSPKVMVKPVSSYKYDRWETDGNVMTEDEANTIYNSDKKYQNIGMDGVLAPNPFGDKTINRANVSDKLAQKYLLFMIKNPKERTRQRVDWLYYAVSINKYGLKHKSTYLKILKRWKDNYDFSQLTKDLKTIENLQE